MCAPGAARALSALHVPSLRVTCLLASLYVLSGVAQPLLMELAKQAGLTDKTCQIYMLAYYLGTASVHVLAWNDERLSWRTTMKTGGVAMIDVVAQTMNYSGATMAGPTIFMIIYSSVTIWCALLSRVLLRRQMSWLQWLSVALVFAGLGITGVSSLDLGPEVAHGTLLLLFGAALHSFMYVLSEAIMTSEKEAISAQKYCAVYGTFACAAYFLWQVGYTRHHFDDLIAAPMAAAGTTRTRALALLGAIALMSCLHSATFFHCVKYVPGGSTSAGILKALQAVLVFAATSLAFCHRFGGAEMCFTRDKAVSLCVVVTGVVLFGKATNAGDRGGGDPSASPASTYARIDSLNDVEFKAAREHREV